jgi:hypothetical protein
MRLPSIAARLVSANQGKDLVPNPFSGSKIPYPVYHGTPTKGVTKFRRPASGVWFSGEEGWVDDLYTGKKQQGEVLTCWINVKNPYEPTEDEFHEYYSYEGMRKAVNDGFFERLQKEGYDAYHQGGESDSIMVFDTVEIVNAKTGEKM